LTTPRIFQGWITYDEFKEAKKWPHEFINVNCFSAWIDDEVSEYPFRPFIDYWFDVKESHEPSDPAYGISKSLAVSPYGKTIQDIEGRSGQLYHPHYAAMTTGICRASIARFIRKNDFKAVMVATDGVLIRKEDLKCIPKRYLDARSNLGEWEIEDQDVDAVVLMSGVYGFVERTATGRRATFIPDLNTGLPKINDEVFFKTKSKERGSAAYFRDKTNSQSWFDFLTEHAEKESVSTIIKRPYSLGEARRIVEENGQKVAQFNLMNIFDEREFTMKARGDSTKRRYRTEHQPETFGCLLSGTYDLDSWDSWYDVDFVLSGGKV